MAPGRLARKATRLRQEAFLWRHRRKIHADRFARFGSQSLIVDPRGVLNPHRIEIGDNVLIHDSAMLSVVEEFNGRQHDPHLSIGSRCVIGHGIWLSCVGEIVIEEDNLIGHNVLIADSYHEYHDPDVPIIRQPMAPPSPVRLGRGCIVGPHVAILAGVTVGEFTFIGANSVLTTSVPPNSVVVGNPGRVVRRYDRERAEWVDSEGRPSPIPA